MRQTGGRRTGGKTRRVRWIGSLWKGKSSTARKEAEKEEVLAVFRELARVQERGRGSRVRALETGVVTAGVR